ncbi:MAG: hypothetical protein JWN44_5385 [Myxococcales bacterium]|nr:hypothetical protein [Myxococcales bacterium]
MIKGPVADEKEDPALTAELSTLAQALPELLDRFRTMARAIGGEGANELSGPPQPALALPLGVAMDAALEVARAEVGKRARIIKLYAPAPAVLATERQLGAMLLGLLTHAAQAVVAGRPDEHQIELRVGTGDDGWARITVTASGPTVEGRAGSTRLELPPAVAPKTELKA